MNSHWPAHSNLPKGEKMFGINMVISHCNQTVKLRPLTKKDLPILVEHFASMKVHMYTMGLFAQTMENEEEWYEKNRKDDKSCLWAIQPKDSDVPIGVTAIHDISPFTNSCTTGIIIWDPTWWGKGIASATHLGRTLFAADYLNRFTIRSSVRVHNEASLKALERVGYTVWGTEPLSAYRAGKWLDTYHLIWVNPDKICSLYPEGTPENLKGGVERAKFALETARSEVVFP